MTEAARGEPGGAPLPPFEERRIGDMLVRQAASRPGAPFLEMPGFSAAWTYGGFLADAARLGGGLRESGLEPGERLGIMLENRPEYILAWLGSVLGGGVDVSINHGLRGPRLAHQLAKAEVRVLVCDHESERAVREVRDELPALRAVVLVDGDPAAAGALRFESLLDADPIEPYPSSPKDTTSIRYTSGTTGPAKAVARTHSALAVHCAHFVWLSGYGPQDTLYTCFPLHHGIASVLGVVTTLMSGGRLVIDERFSASRYWARIGECGATLAHVLNPLVPILMAQPPAPSDRDHRCTRLWTAVPDPAFEARFGARPIYFYGLAEGGTIAYTPPGETAPAGSSGRPSPLFDVRIVDGDEFPVPPGASGEIVWRPTEPHVMSPGYFGDPDATVRAWSGLWFHSGDAGHMDEDGYLFLEGRMGDQIRRKGVNISAEEVEAAALEYGPVVEAAAVAVPSELSESEVKLCVVPGPGEFDLRRFHRHLGERLPAEMVPRYLEERDSLPRTDTHKIAKARLRTEGEGGITAATVDFEAERRRRAPTRA